MSINGIEITDVIVFPVRNRVEGGKVRAFARIILNDNFIINGMIVYMQEHIGKFGQVQIMRLLGNRLLIEMLMGKIWFI